MISHLFPYMRRASPHKCKPIKCNLNTNEDCTNVPFISSFLGLSATSQHICRWSRWYQPGARNQWIFRDVLVSLLQSLPYYFCDCVPQAFWNHRSVAMSADCRWHSSICLAVTAWWTYWMAGAESPFERSTVNGGSEHPMSWIGARDEVLSRKA